MDIAGQWRAALADVVIRHPARDSRVSVEIGDGDPPVLTIALDQTRDSRDWDRVISPFVISNVALTYFPGVTLARQWLAAAWAGYVQHEALELVTVGGLEERPIDPHAAPYVSNPYNRGLRDGFPVELTPETLIAALAVAMPIDAARELAARGAS